MGGAHNNHYAQWIVRIVVDRAGFQAVIYRDRVRISGEARDRHGLEGRGWRGGMPPAQGGGGEAPRT